MSGSLRLVLLAVFMSAAAAPTAGRTGVAAQVVPDALDPNVPADSVHPGAYLDVYVVTAGTGDAVWEQFGHNGIRIVDVRTGQDVIWNWGVFDFRQERFITRLLRGTMLYRMEGRTTELDIGGYRLQGRRVWQQKLDLTPEQKWRLRDAILLNTENPEYRYDYYLDNCSTRIRDMLDEALGGALGRALDEPTETTFRWHTRRLLQRTPWAYLGIQYVLGQRADRPITEWEEAFLPMRLQEHLRSVTVTDVDGRTVPLVAEEYEILGSDRPPAPRDVPDALLLFLTLGVVVGAAIVGAAAWAKSGGVLSRLAFFVAAGGWTLVAGLAGTILLGAWALTDHAFWAWNENLLQTNPLFLVLLVALVPVLWRGALPSWARPVTLAVVSLSLAGFALQILPGVDQVNGEILAFTMPANVGLLIAVKRLAPGRQARHVPEGAG